MRVFLLRMVTAKEFQEPPGGVPANVGNDRRYYNAMGNHGECRGVGDDEVPTHGRASLGSAISS